MTHGFDKGVFADSKIRKLLESLRVFPENQNCPIGEDQVQVSSFEPRLGTKIYVRDYISRGDKDWGRAQELTEGFVIRKDLVYKIPLEERFSLSPRECAAANPKSRIGRSGLYVRLVADEAPELYNQIPFGYQGSAHLEVYSLAFDYVIKPGIKLNQIRFMNENPNELFLTEEQLRKFWHSYRNRDNPEVGEIRTGKKFNLNSIMFDTSGKEIPIDQIRFANNGLVLNVSTETPNENGVVMYVARNRTFKPFNLYAPTNKIDDFFVPILAGKEIPHIKPLQFSLSSSDCVLNCPDNMVMVTTPFDDQYGDFKGDHAGYIDPRFLGTITFEPRVYEGIRMAIRHKTAMGTVRMVPLIGDVINPYGKGNRNAHRGQVGVHPGPHYRN